MLLPALVGVIGLHTSSALAPTLCPLMAQFFLGETHLHNEAFIFGETSWKFHRAHGGYLIGMVNHLIIFSRVFIVVLDK